MLEPDALGGDVVVQDNPELTALGLPGAATLGSAAPRAPFHYPGSIVIRRNAKLEFLGVGGAAAPAEVAGDVVIEANPRLSDWFVLDGLKRVGRDLVLADTVIADLGFSSRTSIESVGGTIDVRDNANLAWLYLKHLQISGGVRLARNAVLHTFEAPALVAVLGHLEILENPSLLLRTRLDALAVVAGTLSVTRNPLVTSLEAFNGVGRVGALTVLGNPKLTILSFAHLTQAGSVSIEENATLAYIGPNPDPATGGSRIPALARLDSVGSLSVKKNPALTQLILPSLRDVSGQTSVTVTDNPLLPTCQANALPASSRTISGNNDGATCP
jgi:hypothetical protein